MTRGEEGATEPAIVQALSDPATYPYPVGRVELIETHISWVFLAGERVYKVKKPVDLGFLDSTTLERRRFFCEEEVRLNQRLTREVSDAGPELLARHRDRYEAPGHEPDTIRVDTSPGPDAAVAQALRSLTGG